MPFRSHLRAVLEALALNAKRAEQEALPLDGITPTHVAILGAVVHVGRKEGVTGIAEMLGLSQSTATWHVQRLENMGLLMRIVPEETSVHSILVTPEGAAVIERAMAAEQYVQEQTLSALPTEERNELLHLLGKLAAIETEINETPSDRTGRRPARR